MFTNISHNPVVEPEVIVEEPEPEVVDPEPMKEQNEFQLFGNTENIESQDSLITKITDYANKHPDLSPIEDNSIPIEPPKSMPKSERTETGWKISFE